MITLLLAILYLIVIWFIIDSFINGAEQAERIDELEQDVAKMRTELKLRPIEK